ncbi:MAG: type II secretion system GspH family protein [Acidobacteria bacterium]|nr:type II secretion system GspH family protein [Acidobacteriota bacterium]
MHQRPTLSSWPRGHLRHGEAGFTIIEILTAILLVGILSGLAIGVSPSLIRTARGESGAQELDSFLKRHREMAIGRRRDIEIRFLPPNQVQSAQRAVPDPPNPTPAPEVLETMTFEGSIEYWSPAGVADTPDSFGNANPITLGGVAPVMFSSEGSLLDAGGNPVNATISLGVDGDPLTATAVTILGTTASVSRWRWTGVYGGWVR